jgi:hypothetical protein
MKFAQEKFQLRDVERGGRAASKVNGRWKNGRHAALPRKFSGVDAARRPYLAQYCFTKSPELRSVE